MKWAKTKDEMDNIRKKLKDLSPNALINGCKDPIKTSDSSPKSNNVSEEDMIQAELHEFYKEIDNKPDLDYLKDRGFAKWLVVEELPKDYKRARARYEAYVGGFLYFFEKHVSNVPDDDRVLYFDWGKINPKAALTIFLNPLYKSDEKNASYQGSEDDVNVWSDKQANNISKTSIASPPSGETDPPPPPPPPPPPREE